jgi:aspartate/methionine/tyrosine aminotransferase
MKLKEFALERFFAKYEHKVKYNLCASDCETYSVEGLLKLGGYDKTAKAFKELSLGYSENEGGIQLREEVASLYKGLSSDDILITNGASEAIFLLSLVLYEGGGKKIVTQSPVYQSLVEMPLSLGCKVVGSKLLEGIEWIANLEEQEKLSRGADVLVINTPHNPTGFNYSRKDFDRMADIATSENMMVIFDESYRYSEYNPESRLPGICEVLENGFSIGGLSKAFGLSGLRIGWLATRNEEVLNKCKSLRDYLSISSSTVSELIAVIALQNKEKILRRNLRIIKNNFALLTKFFKKYKDVFSFSLPNAGPIAFPRVRKENPLNQSAEALCKGALEEGGVLLLPGSSFGWNDHFRIGYGKKNVAEGINRLDGYLTEHIH